MGGQLGGLRRRVHRAADRGDPARDDRLPAPPPALPALGPARPSRRRPPTQTHCPECGVPVAADARSAPRAGPSSATRDAAARRPQPRPDERRGVGKRFGDGGADATSPSRCARASGSRSSAPTAPARRRCCRSSRARWRPTRARSTLPRRRLGPAARRGLLQADRSRENLRCSRGWRRSPTSTPWRAMLELTELGGDEETGKLSGGNRQRLNIAIGLLGDPPLLLLDEPSAVARSAPARAPVGVHRRRSPATVVYSTHDVGEAERYADRVLVLADGELLFTGTPERAAGRRAGPDLETRSSPSCTRRATDVRWLLVKDLQILRRSPLLVALLVLYPVVIAVLIGVALTGGPDEAARGVREPRPEGDATVQPRRPDARRGRLRVAPVRGGRPDPRRRPARRRSQKVRDGEALAALVIPADAAERLQGDARARRRRAADRRGPLQRRGPGQAALRRVDDPLAARRGQRRAVGRRARPQVGRATSTSSSRAGS